MRGGSFLIGIICGFYINKQNVETVSISKPIKAFIFTVLTLPIYASLTNNFVGRNLLLSSFAIGFTRNIWSLAIALLILMCQKHAAGFMNKFLSSRFWMPLSKLGLSFYLIHPVLQYNFISSRKHQMNLDIGFMVSF
jgi:peptidoglycan/LPS O-acetylase OafA/YrhL